MLQAHLKFYENFRTKFLFKFKFRTKFIYSKKNMKIAKYFLIKYFLYIPKRQKARNKKSIQYKKNVYKEENHYLTSHFIPLRWCVEQYNFPFQANRRKASHQSLFNKIVV